MPRFINPIGNSSLSIFICDHCHMKRPYSDMRPDGNLPALKVCSESCSDQFDPYRLPARQSEKITIRFPRPDVDIAQVHNNILWSSKPKFFGSFLLTTQNYHIADINLFYINIRENLHQRIGLYWKK